MSAGTKVTMKAGEVKVYTAQYIPLPTVPNKYTPEDFTAIDNIEFKTNCIIYPTISEDIIFIETTEDVKSVEIINIKGQKMMSENNVNSINISSLPQGLYMLIVNLDKTQEAYKIYRK
jgi:hypothetical protein